MFIHQIKKLLLVTPGVLRIAWKLASHAGKKYGIEVRNDGGVVQLRKGNQLICLLPRQVKRAGEIYESFDVYRRVLPIVPQNGIEITDFTENPDALVWEHLCLKHGTTIESRDGAIWLRKGKRVMILAPQHLVYSVTMAERFDLYFDPLVPREEDGLLILDYSRPGNLQRYARSGLEFEMASFPEEEEAIEEYFKWYRPKEGDLVFDIGAHCGVSTYSLSKLVGRGGKVVSFEPDPLNYDILRRNIERHGLENVIALNVAIAGKTRTLAFNSEGTIGSGLTSLMQRESVGSTVIVEAVSINDAFRKWGTPAFCKIDIEGAEVEALESAREALCQQPTFFAIDTNHPRKDGSLTNQSVEAILRSCGYETLSEANPLMTTWARPKNHAPHSS